jgi:penicillin-insensitive murein endopeptidase
VIRPERKRYFATNEMAYLIALTGNITKQLIPGYKLAIGDISAEKGGRLSPHLSHTNGLDADIAFYFDNKSFQGYFASALEVNKPHHNWMVDEQWALYKGLVRTQLVDRIFIHETLKKEICKVAIKNGEVNKDTKSGPVYETLRRLIADRDHVTHFHMRAKCSSAQIRCRQMAEPRAGTGCF